MIDKEAIKRMTYGLYIIASGNQDRGNGYISNSVFQVSARPAQIAACCNKENHTAKLIQKAGAFSVSILNNDAETSVIDTFGYRSGADTNKLVGMNVDYGATGVPIILNDSIAWLECKVVKTMDVGTHIIFIGKVLQAEVIDEQKPAMTYAEFKETKQRVAPENAPTHIEEPQDDSIAPEDAEKFKCNRCGFVYDNNEEDIPFSDLPDDWICPVCGAPISEFSPQ